MTDATYRDHSIRLRDVADADDPRCPDEMNGCLVVSYGAINDKNATFTEGRSVSSRLPTEFLALFDKGKLNVSQLTAAEREWVRSESAAHSNEIDFCGTETGPAVA